MWITRPFTNWKKATEKIRAHNTSKLHHDSCQLALQADQAGTHGTIAQQLQQVEQDQRKKNREAIKALVRCAHYLVRHHVAHTTNYDLVGELWCSTAHRLHEECFPQCYILFNYCSESFIEA